MIDKLIILYGIPDNLDLNSQFFKYPDKIP